MKVGETIEINGVMLEAVAEISETNSCIGCFLYLKGICPIDEDMNLLCTIEDIIIFKKKMIMERRIGEQFKYEGVTLEVCVVKDPENKPCGDCYFLRNKKCFEFSDITRVCSESFREDERSVYFKEVKK